jgi:glycosyltransferase involved in cell wall biosynthesis
VEFVGLIPKNEIPALADKHDIYLQTNRIDNMPVSVIEMWACGLPIVATDVGGITYLIRNRIDGMLVASEDCQAMAHACFELLYNSELAKKLSCNGRLRASELSWERIQPMWEKALFLDRQTSTKNHRDSHALQSVHGVGFGNHEQPEVDD